MKQRYKKALKKIRCSIKIKTFYCKEPYNFPCYDEPFDSYYYDFYLIIDDIHRFSGYCYKSGEGDLPKFIGGGTSLSFYKILIRSTELYTKLIKLFRKYKMMDDEAIALRLWARSSKNYEEEI